MSQADPVRVLAAGDPYRPAGLFTRAQRCPAGGRRPLPGLPSAAITPHIGGAIYGAPRRGAETATGAAARLRAGETPGQLVNPEVAVPKEAAS